MAFAYLWSPKARASDAFAAAVWHVPNSRQCDRRRPFPIRSGPSPAAFRRIVSELGSKDCPASFTSHGPFSSALLSSSPSGLGSSFYHVRALSSFSRLAFLLFRFAPVHSSLPVNCKLLVVKYSLSGTRVQETEVPYRAGGRCSTWHYDGPSPKKRAVRDGAGKPTHQVTDYNHPSTKQECTQRGQFCRSILVTGETEHQAISSLLIESKSAAVVGDDGHTRKTMKWAVPRKAGETMVMRMFDVRERHAKIDCAPTACTSC